MTPEGKCRVCKGWVFIDGAVNGRIGVLREHSTNDPGVVRRAREKALKEGKRGYRLPACRGSDQQPTQARWPDGSPYSATPPEVRLQWPNGAVYWEGPMGAIQ